MIYVIAVNGTTHNLSKINNSVVDVNASSNIDTELKKLLNANDIHSWFKLYPLCDFIELVNSGKYVSSNYTIGYIAINNILSHGTKFADYGNC